jgi:predicted phage tail protein
LYALSLRGTLYKINAVAQAPTPVELVRFTGISRNNAIDLTWETRNEINVQQYEIQISTNGTDFNQAGIVTANNSSTYRFTHMITTNTNLYYRLRILDIDGKFEYSKIIQVNSNIGSKQNFVKPSIITNNILNLDLPESFDQLQLVSMEGKEVWKQNISGRMGNIRQPLPVLLPGSYIVRLLNKQKIITQKILIR